MEKIIVYPASHVFYDDIMPAVHSALANANVDTIYIMTDGVPFPHDLPANVHLMDVSGQEWFKPDSPNHRNELAFICLVRVAMAKLFPDADRILSLDGDTIIQKDISDLWDLDLTDFYMAGVPETRLSAEKGYPYMNAGMMLFNLRKIREDHLDDLMINNLNRRRYQWLEQDCINEACANRAMVLGSEYNTCFCTAKCDDPKIVHFAADPYWRDYPLVNHYRTRTEEPKVLYLCDGLRPCGGSSGCYRNGGECRHTANEGHALHKDVSERHEILQVAPDGRIYFLEVDDARSSVPF